MAARIAGAARELFPNITGMEGLDQEIAFLRLTIRETFAKDDFNACVRAIWILARILSEQSKAERPARPYQPGHHQTEFSPEFERMLLELRQEEDPDPLGP